MKTLLVLCGGKSDEHEISLISAKCILDALDRRELTPLVVGISKRGVWHLEDEKTFFTGELRADRIRLNESAAAVTLAPYVGADGRGKLVSGTREIGFDAVFPVIHGKNGEDGTLQGLLDLVGVPYVGPGCLSSAVCMDKAIAKALARDAGIPVADYVVLTDPKELPAKRDAIRKLGFPCFVKPSRQGSSVGVSRATSEAELAKAVETAFRHDTKVLVERGISGREIECAVLGLNQSPRASLPGEIVVSKKVGWYSYEAKYLMADGAETVAPAALDAPTTKAVQELALRAFRALECDGMARVDLFLEHGSGKLYLNEANTIPGFTPISMYPKMWEASGLPYPKLISELVRLAYVRLGKTW